MLDVPILEGDTAGKSSLPRERMAHHQISLQREQTARKHRRLRAEAAVTSVQPGIPRRAGAGSQGYYSQANVGDCRSPARAPQWER